MGSEALGEFAARWSVVTIVLSGIALVAGVVFIRRGQRVYHMRAMLTASTLAVLFLVLYLTKVAIGYTKVWVGPPEWRSAYLWLLGSHTLLAALNVPLALFALYNAWRGLRSAGNLQHTSGEPARSFFQKHRAWVRWTVPVWLYVAITGWIIYLVLERYGAVRG